MRALASSLLAFFSLVNAPALAETAAANSGTTRAASVGAVKVASAPALDGRTNVPSWTTALAVDAFTDVTTKQAAALVTTGNGGFATPGTNLSAGVHVRFHNLDELYVNFGSPASPTTLYRFLIKYVFNLGGGSGV